MTDVVQQPPRALLRLALFGERTAYRFLDDRADIKEESDAGAFEHFHSGHALLVLCLRHLEALIELARTDVVLLPAGQTLARGTIEIATRIRWMLIGSDPYLRDARVLTLLEEEQRFATQWTQQRGTAGSHGEGLQEFIDGVRARLPPGVESPRGFSMATMLDELGDESVYLAYRLLSQTVHGTTFATRSYLSGLGNAREHGEWISPSDWSAPLFWSIQHFAVAADRWLRITGVASPKVASPHWRQAILRAVDELEELRDAE